MVSYRRQLLLCLLLTCLCREAITQTVNMAPEERLTISEGLPHNGVSSMLMDSRGYLWVATFDGLARYDGFGTDVFQNLPGKKILVSNRIRDIREDKRGNLILGTDEGVSVYHYKTDRFETIYSNTKLNKGLNGPLVRKVLIMPDGETIIAMTEESGVLVFDTNYKFLKQCVPTGLSDNQKAKYLFASALDEYNLLLSTTTGLLIFDSRTCHFQEILQEEITLSTASLMLDGNRLLVADNDRLCTLRYLPGDQPELQWVNSCPIALDAVDLFKDQTGNLWLATARDGVRVITNPADVFAGRPAQMRSFTTDNGRLRTSCITPAGNDDVWVGSFDKGSYLFSLEPNPFFSSLSSPASVRETYQKSIADLATLDSNRVFISASNGPIKLFNTAKEAFEPLPAYAESVKDRMNCIYVDKDGISWFKSKREIKFHRAGANDLTVRAVDMQDFHIPEDYRFDSLIEDEYGNIWIAFQEGVVRISLAANGRFQKGEFLKNHPVLKNNPLSRIRYVYPDPAKPGIMWVGTTSSGLLRIDCGDAKSLATARIDRYTMTEGLSSNFVSSILRLPNGELWIGTERGGVCRILEQEEELAFEAITTEEGLTNNVVKNLLADDAGNLWISTNFGLNRLNLDTKNVTGYRQDDGLPFEDFSYDAKKMGGGKLLFAGVNGFTLFAPGRIRKQDCARAVEFGDLKLFNRTIGVGESISGTILLAERLQDNSSLQFTHDQNVFSFEVDALHYGTASNHYLSYQLLPDNEDWLKLPPGQRTINFNNLPTGAYELQVRSCKTGSACSEVKTLYFSISPPWWKSYWAYLLYGLLVLAVAGGGVYWITRFQSLRHAVAIEQLERTTAQQLNAEKLRFFSNISHEIKTPVSLIYGPIQLLARRFSKDKIISDNLGLIERQAKKLTRLLEQVQDFQKTDADLLRLKPTSFQFAPFLMEATQDLAFFAKSKGITLITDVANPRMRVEADRDKLEKIIDNLVSNAIKHTKRGDVISVVATEVAEGLALMVKDTGAGIKVAELPYVFDRFYQAESNATNLAAGSGIGLAFTKRLVELHEGSIIIESVEGEGTTVKVLLPIVLPAQEGDISEIKGEVLGEEVIPRLLPSISLSEERITVAPEYTGKKIFLAEDNADMRQFIERFLLNHFEVFSFENGRACLEAMEEDWPDLVLSDVQMPEVDGLSLTTSIKRDLKTSHIPVILLTAFGQDEDRIKGMATGADAYINKPFSLSVLTSTIENLLRNREMLRHRFNIDLPLTLNKENVGNNDFLEQLYQIMQENLDNREPDLDGFAKRLLLNRTHFYQKVKEITGMTPYELLKAFRLKRAAELLVQEGLPVSEVYPATGFKSRSNFSKAFKKQYNVPPSKYAEEAARLLDEGET